MDANPLQYYPSVFDPASRTSYSSGLLGWGRYCDRKVFCPKNAEKWPSQASNLHLLTQSPALTNTSLLLPLPPPKLMVQFLYLSSWSILIFFTSPPCYSTPNIKYSLQILILPRSIELELSFGCLIARFILSTTIKVIINYYKQNWQ